MNVERCQNEVPCLIETSFVGSSEAARKIFAPAPIFSQFLCPRLYFVRPTKTMLRRLESDVNFQIHFCIWIRRLPNVRPLNGSMVSFSALQQDTDQKTARLPSKRVFWAKFSGANGLISPENKEETGAFPPLNRHLYLPCFENVVNSSIELLHETLI